MEKLKKNVDNIFKWNFEQMMKAVIGTFLFSFALNIFIVPMGLYNGGCIGFSQLLRTILVDNFNLDFGFDFAGILNYAFNITYLEAFQVYVNHSKYNSFGENKFEITKDIMEEIFKARWWDYSDRKYNINGRICLSYTFFWGILAIILIMFTANNKGSNIQSTKSYIPSSSLCRA